MFNDSMSNGMLYAKVQIFEIVELVRIRSISKEDGLLFGNGCSFLCNYLVG